MPTLRRGRLAVLPLLLCTVAALTGCGKGDVKVTGKVTYKGTPLTAGTVIFIDSLGAYHQGAIDATGTYTIEKVPPGAVKVGITVPKSTPGKTSPRGGGPGKLEGMEDPRSKGPAPDAARPPDGPNLPANLADPNTSGITKDIKSGTPVDIAIE